MNKSNKIVMSLIVVASSSVNADVGETISKAFNDKPFGDWNITGSYSGHTTSTRDDLGDRKYAGVVIGHSFMGEKELTIDIRTSLETPQNGTQNIIPGQRVGGKPSNQRDTGMIGVAIGVSTNNDNDFQWDASARMGQINGESLTALQDFYGWTHTVNGKSFRRSTASTGSQFLVGATGVGSYRLYQASTAEIAFIGALHFNVNAIGCGTAGTDKTYGAAGAYVTLSNTYHPPKPQQCESPKPAQSTHGLLAGIYAKGVAYDVTTDYAGTTAFQPYTEVQYRQKVYDGLTAFAGLNIPLSTTVKGASQFEIMNYQVGINYQF